MIKDVTVPKEANLLQKGFTWVGSLMGGLNTEDNRRYGILFVERCFLNLFLKFRNLFFSDGIL
jgi:hypothetical protein